jgi:hypothetical protein
MMILETVLSDRYVCQISYFSPQVKYLGEFFMLAATLYVPGDDFVIVPLFRFGVSAFDDSYVV